LRDAISPLQPFADRQPLSRTNSESLECLVQ
jgi:hypothetical protein